MSEKREWETHDELQHDLAECRRAAGDIAVEKLGIGSFASGGQIDVFALKPSWAHTNPTVYEVKVSRADFLSDTQAGKFRRYLPYCGRLYFATPPGMLDKKEIPEGMGWCVRGPNGWRTVVAPRVRIVAAEDQATIVFSALLKIKGGPWVRPDRYERVRRMAETKEINEWTRELPAKIRTALSGADRIQREMQHARAELFRALGEDDDGRDIYQLAHAVISMAPRQSLHVEPVRNRVRNLIDVATRLDQMLADLGPKNGEAA